MLCKRVYLYENRKDITLDTYVLDDSSEMLDGKLRGAVLICPGGGYQWCSDREGEPIAMAFASMGYHTFVLRYSIYNGIEPPPDSSKPLPVREHCLFPNPMRDIGAAMQYIHLNSESWRVDTDRIAICGFSAGGHNCAMYAVYWDKPLITDRFKSEKPLKPAACILAYPLTDYILLEQAARNPDDISAQGLHTAINTALFGTGDPTDEQLLKASPARLVDKNTPPMFIWHTYEDQLVPVAQSLALAQSLTKQGIPYDLHIFESGMHGLSTAMQASSGAKSEINADAAKWIPLCGAWLDKRFAFELPELNRWQRNNDNVSR